MTKGGFTLTKDKLEAVHDALTEIIESWNQTDHGWHNNHALVLTIFDDGSGRLGRRTFHGNEVEDWHEFNNADELLALLSDQGVEIDSEADKK